MTTYDIGGDPTEAVSPRYVSYPNHGLIVASPDAHALHVLLGPPGETWNSTATIELPGAPSGVDVFFVQLEGEDWLIAAPDRDEPVVYMTRWSSTTFEVVGIETHPLPDLASHIILSDWTDVPHPRLAAVYEDLDLFAVRSASPWGPQLEEPFVGGPVFMDFVGLGGSFSGYLAVALADAGGIALAPFANPRSFEVQPPEYFVPTAPSPRRFVMTNLNDDNARDLIVASTISGLTITLADP